MQKVEFDAGEERHVRLMVHAINQEVFTIQDAQWKLLWGGETEAAGECRIKEHVIDAFISPKNRTTYVLQITYQVADETLIEKIGVVVT